MSDETDDLLDSVLNPPVAKKVKPKEKKVSSGFIDDEDEPVQKVVKKVEEKESNKAFEVLETLNAEIKGEKEVKKRAPRKKKTEI